MKNLKCVFLFVFAVAMTGCYHVTVTTGLSPGTTVIDNAFATSWIFGLVPPKTVEAASECPDGVAIVETEQSFVNGVVSILTFGIYTPWHIMVTCAASGSSSAAILYFEVSLAENATKDAVIGAFSIAADKAVRSGETTYVRFE